jgi:hypothetical protein
MKITRTTVQITLEFLPGINAILVSILFLSALQFSASAIAETPKHYVRVGTTVFVSGHFKYWMSKDFINSSYLPADSEPKTETIVFVDVTSERQESVGFATTFRKRAQNRGISTVVIGRCDLFCARLFMSGKERTLAAGAYIDLQVPIDWETKKVEGRWPQTQFNLFEKNSVIAASLKDIYFEAFSQGGLTGGLQVTSTQAQFCKARNPDIECKSYPLDSTLMGLTTSPTPALIELPPELAR